MTRMTPDSFSQRTRCSVAAGDSPVEPGEFDVRAVRILLQRSEQSVRQLRQDQRPYNETLSRLSALTGKFDVELPASMEYMNTNRRRAVAALTAAGLLWGTTVPLSKLALEWLAPGWLTFVRFGLAAAILLAAAPRARVRAACTPSSAGLGRDRVRRVGRGAERRHHPHQRHPRGAADRRHAGAGRDHRRALAPGGGAPGGLGGLRGVAGRRRPGRHGSGGGGATATGDGLVLASLLLSAAFTVAQARRLQGRDPVALTAVQFPGAALAALPFSVAARGRACRSRRLPGAVLAVAALAAGRTLLPFTLFAYAQSRVSAEVAGAFLNLEPLVGAVAGVVVSATRLYSVQLARHGAAILAGIALSSLPLLARGSTAARLPDRAAPGHPQPAAPGLAAPEPAAPDPAAPDPAAPIPAPDPAALEPAARIPQSRILRCRARAVPEPRDPGSGGAGSRCPGMTCTGGRR